MKFVLEAVLMVVAWCATGGTGIAIMHIYHLMIADLNRNLHDDKKIPMGFGFFDSRVWWYNVVHEHRKQFPDSKLYNYMMICYAVMVALLGIFFWGVVAFNRMSATR